MNNHTKGVWRYFRNGDAFFIVCSDGKSNSFSAKLVAEILTKDIYVSEANARLISGAPEMYFALINTLEVLNATEAYMHSQGLDTEQLTTIINVINGLLDRIDGIPEKI